MRKTRGRVAIGGSIAYVAQQVMNHARESSDGLRRGLG